MQNVENANNVIFQPAIFSFNFRLFSFHERVSAFVAPDSDHEKGVKLMMSYTSPEKLDCYSRGRKLPENLTQDILLQETDFSFTFAIAGQDLAFL